MAMNRQNYIEMVVAFLSKLKSETGFNMETPLDHNSRISLSAIANSADNMGEAQIGKLIKKALESNDPKTQEILLYSGISQGPITDKDIKSVFRLASEKLKSMGGNPEGVAANAIGPEEEESDIAPFSDLLGDTGESSPEEGDEDSLSSLLDDSEELGSDDPEEDVENPAKPMGDEPDEYSEDSNGRIAKESDEEIDVEPEPEPVPMNDWYNRFNLYF